MSAAGKVLAVVASVAGWAGTSLPGLRRRREKPAEKTEADLERLEAAHQKRKRKLARNRKNRS